MSKMDLLQLIDVAETNSKMVSDVLNIAKHVMAKDPHALDKTFLEYTIKNHFGESTYDKIQTIYKNIVGT